MPKWTCRAVLEGRVQCREKPPGCLSEWLAVASRSANSWEGPSGPRPRQHSAPPASWASAVLMGPWRHSVVLICISLMEHLLMDLLSVSISFLVRCLLGSLDHFISSVCSFPYYREDNLKRLGSVSFRFCDVMQKAKPWT